MAKPITRFLETHPEITKTQLAEWATASGPSKISENQLDSYDEGNPAPRDRALAISLAMRGEITIDELLFPGGVPYGARLTSNNEPSPKDPPPAAEEDPRP